uniref:ABC transporter C family member 13 (Trinotate prediction) n=1 Tax=Myxobolus squamalis TaxID=59785 RepID=A0A6B2G2H8_MYXSQ
MGDVINRFLTDTYAIDETIPFTANIFLAVFFNLLGTLTTICITSPLFLSIIPLLLPLLAYLQHIYRRTTNDIKRINTSCLSPIYSSLSETYDNSIIRGAL